MGNQGLRQHVEMSSKTGVFHMSKAKLQHVIQLWILKTQPGSSVLLLTAPDNFLFFF